MTPFLRTAIDAALLAGDFISQAANKVSELEVSQKNLHDYVSDVDRDSEKLISDLISKEFPEHAVLGEEFGQRQIEQTDQQSAGVESDYQWIVDPLDGTTNFLRSIPHYAISIALLKQGEVEVAVVYDPAKKDLFYAQRGQGAFLNDVAMSTSPRKSVRGSLLATGIPFSGDNLLKVSSFTASMEGLLNLQTSGIRRLGAAALDLAYVACGRYDGFWESNLQIWDIAAGVLLVTEAGGKVTDLVGGEDYLKSGNMLAANKSVHQDMLMVTANHYASH